MTRDKIASILKNVPDVDNVGCNGQPSLSTLISVLGWNAPIIVDVQFPYYDTMFIRFKEKVKPLDMALFVAGMMADEISEAEKDDLNYLDGGNVSAKCKKNLKKYIRFWWD